MSEKTKLTLSAKELELVCNTEWILTKHLIIEKVYVLFGEMAVQMKDCLEKDSELPIVDLGNTNAKISRGENYRGLPYVMLDYPRNFSKDATMAIRTLFWWGNFFSVTLQLSGIYKDKALPLLIEQYQYLGEHGFWYCIHKDPWQHHFDDDNYVPVDKISPESFAVMLNREPFIKIAKRITLEHWDIAPQFIEQSFKEMIVLLKPNSRDDKRGPLSGTPTIGFGL